MPLAGSSVNTCKISIPGPPGPLRCRRISPSHRPAEIPPPVIKNSPIKTKKSSPSTSVLPAAYMLLPGWKVAASVWPAVTPSADWVIFFGSCLQHTLFVQWVDGKAPVLTDGDFYSFSCAGKEVIDP